MIVKKYIADSIREALSLIRKDMGPDAMIISTKRMPGKNGKKQKHSKFEVLALEGHNIADAYSQTNNICNISSDNSSKHSELDSQHLCDTNSKSAFFAIKNELTNIKDMLFLHDNSGVPDFIHINPESLNLYKKLISTGISKKRVHSFIEKSCRSVQNKKFVPGQLKKEVIKNILSSIKIINPFDPNNSQSKRKKRNLSAFIGPTGVGKTTTIAKLAADLSLRQKINVGLISVDSYKIGAVEQLKTYATIMGVPFLSAFTVEDIKLAINRMKHQDVILIDTAGNSHLDKRRIQELRQLLSGENTIRTHLVLSTVTRQTDMKTAVENFSELDPETYIFTKVDETGKPGEMIDQILDYDLPISFVTNGQKVPEDIKLATKKIILQLVLKTSHERSMEMVSEDNISYPHLTTNSDRIMQSK